MMVNITELDLNFVKDYLRVDTEEEDTLIQAMILAAKSYIENYLNRKFEEFEEVPVEFTIAALSIISHWYERREIQSTKDDRGELLYVFKGLLDQHKNWG